MGKKKSDPLGVIGVAIVAIGAIIMTIPKEVWILIGVGLAAYALYRIYDAFTDKPSPPSTPDPTPASRPSFRQPSRQIESSGDSGGYRIPERPRQTAVAARWIPANEPIQVADLVIPGGMVYVGGSLLTLTGSTDPALIDPSLEIASPRAYIRDSNMGYWPSYSSVSPTARRGYLKWLSSGRADPDADIGYVFLFFYGLERRVLIDAPKDAAVAAELPAIAGEIRRLTSIYGEKSGSVRNYFSKFLELVEGPVSGEPLYDKPIPPLPPSYELPFYLRLALGQTAVAKVPVPAHLALAWAEHDPTIGKRTPIVRCREQFHAMFAAKYRDVCGDGIRLQVNRTKLKLVYRPASSGFRGVGEIARKFGDIPDVTSLLTVTRTLQTVVDACGTELDAYSRYIKKNPDQTESLEAILQLPASIWPQAARDVLSKVSERMGAGLVAMPLSELTAMLNAGRDLTRDRMLGFARALESMNIGIEPDVLNGAKLPKANDKIVLFAMQPGDAQSRSGIGFNAAAVTLQLATAVAHADGALEAPEILRLSKQIDAWHHLTPAELRRLKAHLRLLLVAPVPIATIKKNLEPLDSGAKRIVGAFAATIAQMDGVVTQAEMKALEKIYTLLGIPSKQLYSDIHVSATVEIVPGAPATIKPMTVGASFTLDPARIAALQRDSERVSSLLSNIFVDEKLTVTIPDETVVEAQGQVIEAESSSALMGLDTVHSAFVRMLVSRPQWSRLELEDVAADLELMLDGALEHINEAAYDKFDIPVTLGDDPIETNSEILEMIKK
ncbi:MAG: TerB N-terminal domain-containing protein [Betaproteobacteria bacterium]